MGCSRRCSVKLPFSTASGVAPVFCATNDVVNRTIATQCLIPKAHSSLHGFGYAVYHFVKDCQWFPGTTDLCCLLNSMYGQKSPELLFRPGPKAGVRR